MPIEDLDALERKLAKRGFRREDVLFHDCPACKVHAVAMYLISGRTGGRDIAICHACGHAESYRSGAGLEKREQEIGFDLQAFLR